MDGPGRDGNTTSSSAASSLKTAIKMTSNNDKARPKQPRIVHGYALQGRLGAGSFATVYKGVRVTTTGNPNENQNGNDHDAVVAVKVIARGGNHRGGAALTPKLLENLELEIALLQTFSHPNIVGLRGGGVHKTERHVYLLLEYCGGGDAQRLIRTRPSGRLSERLTRRLFRDLAGGLRFLRAKGLIHRDIKPQNLLLTGPLPPEETEDVTEAERRATVVRSVQEFRLKIADFGFARPLARASMAETLCGSPLYMAPEILEGQKYDEKADLWSVGTVLFEMISGRPPFTGDNHIQLLRNINTKCLRIPEGIQVSPQCVQLLRILLHRSPRRRAEYRDFFEATDAFVALGCNGTPAPVTEPLSTGTNHITANTNRMETVAESLSSSQESSSMDEVIDNNNKDVSKKESSTSSSSSSSSDMTETTTRLSSVLDPNNTQNSNPTGRMSFGNRIMVPPQSQLPTQQHQQTQPPILSNLLQQTQQVCQQAILTVSSATQRQPTTAGQNKFSPLSPSPPGPRPMKSSSGLWIPPPFSLDGPFSTARSHNQNNNQNIVASTSTSQTPQHPQSNHRQGRFSSLNYSQQQQQRSSESCSSSGEFVMVEHGSVVVSTNSLSLQQQPINELSVLSLSSDSRTNSSSKGDSSSNSSSQRQTRGRSQSQSQRRRGSRTGRWILSTSPEMGGALVAMMSGGGGESFARIAKSDTEVATKMLVTAEDIGRRAVNVAHLGDTRAYLAMKALMLLNNSQSNASSAMVSAGGDPHQHRSSSTVSQNFVMDEDDDDDEMPFAMPESEQQISSSPPVALYQQPRRSSISASSMGGAPATASTTTATSAMHFREALSCYLKAMSLMKNAIHAVRFLKERMAPTSSHDTGNDPRRVALLRRCGTSLEWLTGQFGLVLERADAADARVGTGAASGPTSSPSLTSISVEELIYDHALSCGRDGAVKQLLGNNDAAVASYRSAGLLTETLLMNQDLCAEDRAVLEDHIGGFLDRMAEVDHKQPQPQTHPHQHLSQGSNHLTLSKSPKTSVVGLVGGVVPRSSFRS